MCGFGTQAAVAPVMGAGSNGDIGERERNAQEGLPRDPRIQRFSDSAGVTVVISVYLAKSPGLRVRM